MQPVPFAALPLVVRLTAMATFFIAWILFAELVIDRMGLDRYLPLYRVGRVCPYDLLALALIGLLWRRLRRR